LLCARARQISSATEGTYICTIIAKPATETTTAAVALHTRTFMTVAFTLISCCGTESSFVGFPRHFLAKARQPQSRCQRPRSMTVKRNSSVMMVQVPHQLQHLNQLFACTCLLRGFPMLRTMLGRARRSSAANVSMSLAG